jgi:uncharacterized protein
LSYSDFPGSAGEHFLQEQCGTSSRARNFYDTQVTGRLTPTMQDFIARMEMAFIATADLAGECDCSFRAGPRGFIRVLSDRAVAYPEYRGNGVKASLGNIVENSHIGIFLADFTEDLVGLHINGRADIVTPDSMRAFDPGLPEPDCPGRQPEHWVVTTVVEAYIHCSKHIPKLVPQSRVRHWGTDNPRYKGGDYFGTGQQNAADELSPGTTGGQVPLPTRLRSDSSASS